ncbi:hypothetical protein [Priestia koreensis]|uniref:hypothetical protein n=1 Tax=Priestia koreensis TaxID=284581 RepID=UPI00203F9CF8|nr:hypothetical protein [Priestia koreensis]MCM3004580.1 hypothetical protein [Priestia koreensis]
MGRSVDCCSASGSGTSSSFTSANRTKHHSFYLSFGSIIRQVEAVAVIYRCHCRDYRFDRYIRYFDR